ncbi:Rne/Rng family ribonuclease [Serpentinicella sp. ANB-PHB4]|uniref:Rne/Rng family ribonuclease n=1 Tax=Serpentinicella sp. ANB-PHB4 TaxID=3074076 RepID=UPI00285A543D|nr:Rne/Rng family ribonuclease [Serpentinicella sp. ANB-PHB4]MDR5657898.1 Rne/Rng family ribonuclease [Serpentinicella sp. ANB-PHB4]
MKQILVDVGVSESRLALLEDNNLVEFYIERKNNKKIVGNVYKGRVINVLPGMEAAFVDIGLEKNGFLHVKDAIPEFSESNNINYENIHIKDYIKQGQEIIVQVIKDPIGSKGARLTTHITLPGRFIVLMPTTDYIGVSRRIVSDTERDRLREEIEQIKPNNMGVIVRTVAEGKTKEDFNDDIKFLLKLWQKIEKEKLLGYAPRRIYKEFDLISRNIRDKLTTEIDEFIINDEDEFSQAQELIELLSPSLKNRIKLYSDDMELFENYTVESQLSKNLNRKIWLKSGGYIVIDSTEALTVIDVNTGKYVGSTNLSETILKTNIEAAQEIGKQLRLRDIGGIIIIDFIDMIKIKDGEVVLSELEKVLLKDPTKTKILGLTQLGLVELTRKKVRERLESALKKDCICCEGTGKVLCEYVGIQKIEKELVRLKTHTNAEAVIFEVHTDTLKLINKDTHILSDIENKTKIKSFFLINDKLRLDEFKVKLIGRYEFIKKELSK